MDFTFFHFTVAALTIAYTVMDVRPLVGRQYLFGAEIHLGALCASWVSQRYVGDLYPVLWFSMIDVVAVTIFAVIMLRKKAIWAAACVLLHTVMLVIHPVFFIGRQMNQSNYLWALGILTFLVALTINIGTMAGRHEFGRKWDDFLVPRLRGWSWSGTFAPRLTAYKKKVG